MGKIQLAGSRLFSKSLTEKKERRTQRGNQNASRSVQNQPSHSVALTTSSTHTLVAPTPRRPNMYDALLRPDDSRQRFTLEHTEDELEETPNRAAAWIAGAVFVGAMIATMGTKPFLVLSGLVGAAILFKPSESPEIDRSPRGRKRPRLE